MVMKLIKRSGACSSCDIRVDFTTRQHCQRRSPRDVVCALAIKPVADLLDSLQIAILGHFDHAIDLLEPFARRWTGTTYPRSVIARAKLKFRS